MTARTCCKRTASAAGWFLPGATLALLPKCPACLAGYIALATGAGVSFSTATYLRASLAIVSIGALVFAGARGYCRRQRRGSKATHARPSVPTAVGSGTVVTPAAA